MTVRILVGDCREQLRALPDESVHCVVTSPPYWGLRDYGHAGQIGLEATFDEWLARMVDVFREIHRVLRADGTAWVNMGDAYNSGTTAKRKPNKNANRGPHADVGYWLNAGSMGDERVNCRGLKPKDLIGQPWRLAFALQAAGWYLRQDIIWAKPNPMPESVRDRATKAHEYLFLLAKSGRYYFDFEAFSEPRVGNDDAGVAGWASGDEPHDAVSHSRQKGDAKTFRGGQYVGNNKFKNSHATERDSTGNRAAQTDRRNRRSVWTIPSGSFDGAHFATFPPALIEPCILAGCPRGGVVLDPFFGAGTTGLVAERHGRDCIGIELNPQYADMARRRIKDECPMFAEVA